MIMSRFECNNNNIKSDVFIFLLCYIDVKRKTFLLSPLKKWQKAAANIKKKRKYLTLGSKTTKKTFLTVNKNNCYALLQSQGL